MRLLVTGGAGYIGGVVTLHLLRAGHQVTVLDDLSTGHADSVPDGATFVPGDVAERSGAVLADGDPYDGVLHFAAKAVVSESVEHPERYWRTNVAGTLALLDAMRANAVPRLVFSSTAATYGEPDEVPIPETAPTRPTNPYGASKLAVDLMITSEAAAHGLGATSLRYFNVAGASGGQGERHSPETHIIPIALQVVAGTRPVFAVNGTDYPTPDGTGVRDYIHVEDLAAAHVNALAYLRDGGTPVVLNCGYGHGYSVREVIKSVERIAAAPVAVKDEPRRAGDPPILVARADKVRSTLGWTPRLDDLDLIVKTSLEWERKLQRTPW